MCFSTVFCICLVLEVYWATWIFVLIDIFKIKKKSVSISFLIFFFFASLHSLPPSRVKITCTLIHLNFSCNSLMLPYLCVSSLIVLFPCYQIHLSFLLHYLRSNLPLILASIFFIHCSFHLRKFNFFRSSIFLTFWIYAIYL